MRLLRLANRNKCAQVDDNLFGFLSQYRWVDDGRGYILTHIDGKAVRLHRFIMNAQPGEEIDHTDGDKYNNLTSNLRFANRSLNAANRPLFKNNTSGFKGVVRHGNRWRAQVRVNGVLKYFGFFKKAEDAAIAYNEAAKKIFGKFARLNQI